MCRMLMVKAMGVTKGNPSRNTQYKELVFFQMPWFCIIMHNLKI